MYMRLVRHLKKKNGESKNTSGFAIKAKRYRSKGQMGIEDKTRMWNEKKKKKAKPHHEKKKANGKMRAHDATDILCIMHARVRRTHK